MTEREGIEGLSMPTYHIIEPQLEPASALLAATEGLLEEDFSETDFEDEIQRGFHTVRRAVLPQDSYRRGEFRNEVRHAEERADLLGSVGWISLAPKLETATVAPAIARYPHPTTRLYVRPFNTLRFNTLIDTLHGLPSASPEGSTTTPDTPIDWAHQIFLDLPTNALRNHAQGRAWRRAREEFEGKIEEARSKNRVGLYALEAAGLRHLDRWSPEA